MKKRYAILLLAIAVVWYADRDRPETAPSAISAANPLSAPEIRAPELPRIPASTSGAPRPADFVAEVLDAAAKKYPALRAKFTPEVTFAEADFAKLRWQLYGTPIENSEERWVRDPASGSVKADLESPWLADLESQAHPRFTKLSPAELLQIVNETLGEGPPRNIHLVGEPQALWVHEKHRFVPVYEFAFSVDSKSMRQSEIWRIDSSTKRVLHRAPQSRHGGEAQMGIVLKSKNGDRGL